MRYAVAPPAASTKPLSGSGAAGAAASAAARAPWATSRRANVRYPVCPRVSGAGRGSACRGAAAGSAPPAPRARAVMGRTRALKAAAPRRARAAMALHLIHPLAVVRALAVKYAAKANSPESGQVVRVVRTHQRLWKVSCEALAPHHLPWQRARRGLPASGPPTPSSDAPALMPRCLRLRLPPLSALSRSRSSASGRACTCKVCTSLHNPGLAFHTQKLSQSSKEY